MPKERASLFIKQTLCNVTVFIASNLVRYTKQKMSLTGGSALARVGRVERATLKCAFEVFHKTM